MSKPDPDHGLRIHRWEDPPPSRVGGAGLPGAASETARALADRPGEWAVVAVRPLRTRTGGRTAGSGGVLALRTRKWFQQAFSGWTFQTKQRIIDGELVVYARMLPPEPSE